MLDAVQRAAGKLPAARGLQHRSRRSRPCCAASASPPRISTSRAKRSPAAGRCASRSRSCCSRRPGSAAARRADQPPRSRGAQLARGIPLRLSARGDSRLARSLLPRRGRDPHHRDRPAQADRLRRQLQRLSRRARGAHGAAAPAEARSGRRARADAGVHQPVPVPGDESRAGPEPHQDAGQDRPDRDSARTQARPLHVSRRARRAAARCSICATCARPTARASCSTASTCTSSAAIASRSSARTAPANPR